MNITREGLGISDRVRSFLIVLPPLLLAASDLAARVDNRIAFWAALYWIAAMLVTFLTPLVLLVLRPRSLVAVIIPAVFIAVSLVLASQDRFVNFEATQQIGCFMSQFHTATAGFLSQCFLSYPTRTYYFAGLPSLLFGRSTAALNAGQHLIAYSGLAAFTLGVSTLYGRLTGAVLVILATALAFSSRHTPFLLLNFEQGFFPFSLALQFTGFCLLYCASSRLEFLSLATMSAIFAAFSYTPALSLTALALALWALLFVEQRTVSVGTALLSLAITLITAIVTRHDYSLGAHGPELSTLLTVQQIRPFLSMSWNNPLAHPGVLVTLLGLIVIVLGNSLRIGRSDAEARMPLTRHPRFLLFILVPWALLTVVASIALRGYANPPPEFAVHRAILAFPVLSGLLMWLAFAEHKPNAAVCALAAFSAGVLCWQLGMQLSDAMAYKSEPPPALRVMTVAHEAIRTRFFQLPSLPRIFFELPGEGNIVDGRDFNVYYRLVEDYQGVAHCSDIPAEVLPALIVLNRKTSVCPQERISQCIALFFLWTHDLALCQLSG